MPQSTVILDTNVFVSSGFNAGSASRRITDAIRKGDLVLVWHERTRRESLHVVAKIPPLSESDVEELFQDEGRHDGELDTGKFRVVEDASDRKFAALAAATGAPLVTGDHHLLDHRDELEIAVMRPGEFVEGEW